MFVVMAVGASEAEILGVKSQILAEGMTPFDHVGAERTVIAVVGEIGARKPVLIDRLSALSGRRVGHPDQPAVQADVARIPPRGHRDPGPRRGDRRRVADGHGRAMLRGEPGAAVRDGRRGGRGRRHDPARRRLQATDEPVRLPGPRRPGRCASWPRLASGPACPVITEVMEPNQVDIVAEYADILQIGTRNMQNYSLLRDVGRVARPVMLKRGYGATVEEWLMAAEYIVSSGNPNVILCERGIRTFETYTRNTLDLAAVPLVHHLTHLPVIVDPSHATGKRWLVKPLAIGGVAVGADGVMVEVHPRPDEALSDAEQQLDLDQFRDLMAAIVPVHEQVRTLHGDPLPSGRAGPAAAAGWPGIERARGTNRGGRPARRRACPRGGATARRAAPARRQVDQPPGADAGGAGRRARAGSTAPATARTSGRRRAIVARARRLGRARSRPTAGRVAYRVVSPGADGLTEPDGILDCGNSGTSLRLIAGILAGLPMTTVLDGDASLRRRPVARIIEPLRSMGAVLHARRNDTLPPLTVVGHTPLRAIDIATPVPSAQVKSAILLAGLRADGRTTVREAVATRDHTERMLRARGVAVEREDSADGRVAWTVQGGVAVGAVQERVPGDVSAAAFWLVGGRDPSRRRADAPRRRRQSDAAGGDRHPAIDGRRDRGATAPQGRRRRRRRADRGPGRPLLGAPRASTSGRPRWPPPSTRSRSCAWRRQPARGTTTDPRRRRAAPQGIGPDRGHRGRAASARRPRRGRRRRPAHRGWRAAPRRPHRQPRRPPPGDDLRHRGSGRRG